MLIRTCVLAATLVWTTAVCAQSAAQSAHADIVNAQGKRIGTATIRRADGGIAIDVEVSQLPPGTHGIHIHTVGKCEGPAFTSAGAHLKPDLEENTEKTIPRGRTPETWSTSRWRLAEMVKRRFWIRTLRSAMGRTRCFTTVVRRL